MKKFWHFSVPTNVGIQTRRQQWSTFALVAFDIIAPMLKNPEQEQQQANVETGRWISLQASGTNKMTRIVADTLMQTKHLKIDPTVDG